MTPQDVAMNGSQEWVRIDQLISAAASALQVGESVQIETFSLFEAMSAVEVGNPKMDSAATPAPSVQELLATDTSLKELTLPQQLAIMEKLLLLQTSHMCFAAPLAATVYTSLHMNMSRDKLRESFPLLSVFCEGVEQVCAAVRYIVFYGTVSEEEDFNLLITGLPLDVSCPVGSASLPDESAVRALSKALKDTEAASKTDAANGAIYQAITARLAYLKHVLQALLDLQRKTRQSLDACHTACVSALTSLRLIEEDSPVSQSDIDTAPGFVPGLHRYLLGPAPPRAVQVPTQKEAWSALRVMIGQIQDATSVKDAIGFRQVRQWIDRFASINCGVVARSAAHYLVAGKTWADAAQPQPQPPLGAGAAPAGAVVPASQPGPSAEWSLDRPLICEALALPQSPQICEEVETFLTQAVIAIGNWAQAMLLNSCRRRRRLRRGLEDWANLYQHALNADISPAFNAWMTKTGWVWQAGQAGPANPATGEPDIQGPLATWVAEGTAACQLLHLLLGFPLDLYQPSEYCCVYWYCHHLLGCQRGALRLMESVRAPAGGKAPMLPAKAGKGSKAKAPPPPAFSPATMRRQAGQLADAVYTEVMGQLCLGLTQLTLALQMEGYITPPNLHFNTLRERFDLRFGSFHSSNLVRPDPLGLENFQDATRVDGTSPANLLLLAAGSFSGVRENYAALKRQALSMQNSPVLEALSEQQKAELACFDKVAMANSLAAAVLIKTWAEETKEKAAMTEEEKAASVQRPKPGVRYDFAAHPYFFTLKIKSAAAAAGAKK